MCFSASLVLIVHKFERLIYLYVKCWKRLSVGYVRESFDDFVFVSFLAVAVEAVALLLPSLTPF